MVAKLGTPVASGKRQETVDDERFGKSGDDKCVCARKLRYDSYLCDASSRSDFISYGALLTLGFVSGRSCPLR